MVVPLLVMDFLFFYMMFEGVLNLLAELTDFGDRDFYEVRQKIIDDEAVAVGLVELHYLGGVRPKME